MSPTVCFGLSDNFVDASFKCKKEFWGNCCVDMQSSILMIGINILIYLQVSIKLRQYLSSTETTLLAKSHVIFLEPFWKWYRNNFNLTEEDLALRWRHFWINPLLDKNIILCGICRNVIPDTKTVVTAKLKWSSLSF